VYECFDRNSVSLDVLYVFNTFLIDDFTRLFYDVFTQKDFVIMIFSRPKPNRVVEFQLRSYNDT
jgi:hypothetical protein